MDHRVVEGHIEELLRLCQLSEEYCQFMLAKMRDTMAPQVCVGGEEGWQR